MSLVIIGLRKCSTAVWGKVSRDTMFVPPMTVIEFIYLVALVWRGYV